MAPSSATGPSCTYEGGSATWRVSGWVRGDLIPGSASWKGWLGSSQVPTLGGMCVLADHNPRRVCILQVASFTTIVVLTTQRPFQLWPQGSQQERWGRLSHFLYASTPPPQLILIPPEVLPLQGLRIRGQADLKTYSCAAFQSNESDRASDMIICCSSF